MMRSKNWPHSVAFGVCSARSGRTSAGLNAPVVLGLVVAGLLGGGCSKKPAPIQEMAEADAGAHSQSNVDPALVRAVAAAASASPKNARAQADSSGPPENGVFAPGRADQELPPGAPAKITMGPSGNEPRVALTDMQPKAGKYPMRVRVQAQRGGRGDLPIDFRIVVEVTKPKADVSDAGSAPMGMAAVAKVNEASLDSVLVGTVPPEVTALLGKLKGSQVAFSILPSGAGSDFKVVAAKNTEPGLEGALRSLSDALAAIAIPYPTEPMGADAYWGATTRESVLDIDTVAYRFVKVGQVEGNRITLGIETKRYAASAAQRIPGLTPANDALELQRFEAQSMGTMQVSPGSIFPLEASFTQAMAALASIPGQPEPVLLQEKVTVVISSDPPGAAATAGTGAAKPGPVKPLAPPAATVGAVP